jgi:hypothetical protein
MVKSVDIAVFYKEFPHTDFYERAEKLVSLVARTLNKVRRQLNHTYAESYIRGIIHTPQPNATHLNHTYAATQCHSPESYIRRNAMPLTHTCVTNIDLCLGGARGTWAPATPGTVRSAVCFVLCS